MTLYSVLPLLALGLNVALLILVLRRRPKSAIHRVFSLFLFGMALWGLTIYGMRASPTLQSAFWWEKVALAVGPWSAVFFYHFTFLFGGIRPRRVILWGAYVIAVGLSIMSFHELTLEGMQIKPYGYAPIFDVLFLVYMLAVNFLGWVGLWNLIRTYRNPRSLDEKNRAAYIIIGIAFTFVGGFTDILPVMGVPSYPLGIVGNILFSVFTAVAILRYRLLDITIILRKGAAYSVVSALVVGVYVGLVFLVNSAFQSWGIPLSLLANLLLVLVVATGLQPALSRIQRTVDRWFYRERYDYIEALARFSRETKDTTDLEALSSSLVNNVTLAMQCSRACLLLPLPRSNDFALRSSWGIEADSHVLLRAASPLILWLQRYDGVLLGEDLDVAPLLQAMPAEERQALAKMGGALIVPMKTRSNLTGVLLLGEKLSQQPYSAEDIAILQTVTQQAAVNFENARLYQELREQIIELQNTRDQLIRSEKLAMVGKLAANVAHEINNPLQSILNETFLLASSISAEDPNRSDLAIIESEALRARGIVRSLLDFARQREPQKESLDINDLIESLIPLVRSYPQSMAVELLTQLGDGLPRIEADPGQLTQVFLNLITNALDSMPKGGRLTINTAQLGETVVIAFMDTGMGIFRERQSRIFEPFFTTKAHGSGLGLPISQGIIDAHGGDIAVESEPGKGTTFTVTLPLRVRTRGGQSLARGDQR